MYSGYTDRLTGTAGSGFSAGGEVNRSGFAGGDLV
jgi:hypothetical protein